MVNNKELQDLIRKAKDKNIQSDFWKEIEKKLF